MAELIVQTFPNNSFKPKLLRSGNGVAEKACHAFPCATQFGLIQALGHRTRELQSLKITDFLILDAVGDEIAADPHGNNVAFCCPACGHPVLAVALSNQRGSDEDHPAVCKGCKAAYFLDVRHGAEKLYIQVAHSAA